MSRFLLLRVSTLPFTTLSLLRAGRAWETVGGLLEEERRFEVETASLTAALHAAAGGRIDGEGAAAVKRRMALVRLRRDAHNDRPFDDADLAEVSTGSFEGASSISDRLRRYVDHREILSGRRLAFQDAFDADQRQAREAISALCRDPFIEEGIALASRSLPRQLRALASRAPDAWGHGDRHAASKAAAYLARFTTKTSPNALFCATSPASAGGARASIEGRPLVERMDVLLNIYEAGKVVACLAASRDAEPAVVPRPNPTLRKTEDGWTFWKPASLRHLTDEETLSRVKAHPVVESLLDAAAAGELPVSRLIEAVADRFDLPIAELEAFYRTLVDRGILIAEVEIHYNCRRPLRELARACRAAGCRAAWIEELERIEDLVDSIPSLQTRGRAEAMSGIGESLERLPHVRPLKRDELFRVDAASSLCVRLPARVLDEIRPPLRMYARLFSSIYPARMYELSLAARFLEKYPADHDVEFLDLYHGLLEPQEVERPSAFPEPAGLARPGTGVEEASRAMERIRGRFADLARKAAAGSEIEIDEDEVAALTEGIGEPRWSAGVLFQIAAREAADLDAGRYRLVLGALFPGVGLALSRFFGLHETGVSGEPAPIVRELTRGWSALQREGAVVAEITYNHRARTANAGLRPMIFRHEIELPGERATPGAEVIHLRDLRVRFDTVSGRFVLHWPARGLEVIPVITSGVNPTGIISFLVAIGQQGFQPLGYFPGFEAEGVTRWPRVVSGRTVLFRQRWVFRPGEGPASAAAARKDHSEGDYFREVARWRLAHEIPRHVFIHTSDDPKPRYVDLESPLFLDHLRRSAESLTKEGTGDRHRQTLTVTEMLPGPEDLWIAGPEGRFASEFLVQMEGPVPDDRIRERHDLFG